MSGYVTVIVSLFPVPAKLINISRDQNVLEGSNMALFCEATGRPTPNITWTRVFEDGRNGEILLQGQTWDFLNISRTDSGTYRCAADNGFGNVLSQVVRVNVTCKYFTCLVNKLTPVIHASVLLLVMNLVNIVVVAVDPSTTFMVINRTDASKMANVNLFYNKKKKRRRDKSINSCVCLLLDR